MELSIIIPAYDEARKIAADVDAAGIFLADNNIAGEIIVVDDGSTDGTGDAAPAGMLQFRIPLTVITLQHHAGKGAAVRRDHEVRGDVRDVRGRWTDGAVRRCAPGTRAHKERTV
ncbi:MAG: glycosyltransferase [Ignavibacteriae bacterium]|nr:glycosyltransferase [Ignavibacteriota bacterium]